MNSVTQIMWCTWCVHLHRWITWCFFEGMDICLQYFSWPRTPVWQQRRLHPARIVAICGPFPEFMLKRARYSNRFFTRHGVLTGPRFRYFLCVQTLCRWHVSVAPLRALNIRRPSKLSAQIFLYISIVHCERRCSPLKQSRFTPCKSWDLKNNMAHPTPNFVRAPPRGRNQFFYPF